MKRMTNPDPEFGRRDLLRTGGVAVTSGVLASLAGCSTLNGGDDKAGIVGGGGGESVPADANAVFYLDAGTLMSDSALRSDVNDRLDELADTSQYSGPTTVEELLGAAEDEIDLDPAKLSDVLAFGQTDDSSGYGGAIISSDWTEDELVDALETSGYDYTDDKHEGKTIYVQDDDADSSAVGVLSSGTFVVGTTDAVEDVIDVETGNGEAIAGTLKQTYSELSGMVRFAMEVPASQIPESGSSRGRDLNLAALNGAEYISGSVSKSGDSYTAEMTIDAEDEDAATAIKDMLESGRTMMDDHLESSARETNAKAVTQQYFDELRTFLDGIELSTSGSTVTAAYTDGEGAVAGVLFALTAGVLINTAGFLQSKSEDVGQQPGQQVTNRLQIVSAVGEVEDSSIGVVKLTVKKAPGADDIDLREMTVQWVDNSGAYILTHGSTDGDGAADGTFGSKAFKDDDSSAPVLNDPDDRMVLVFDLGSASDETAGAVEFGQELPEGETATVELTTMSGATSVTRLVVPESLAEKAAVNL